MSNCIVYILLVNSLFRGLTIIRSLWKKTLLKTSICYFSIHTHENTALLVVLGFADTIQNAVKWFFMCVSVRWRDFNNQVIVIFLSPSCDVKWNPKHCNIAISFIWSETKLKSQKAMFAEKKSITLYWFVEYI